ncbi:MAG: hypoxanthine phosphoribosyltransferase [Desulfococcaceae bacterium]
MPELIPILNKTEIEERVENIARRISADYRGGDLVLIGVLKGAFVFLSDLIRLLTIPVKIDFVHSSSYGDATTSSGNIQLIKGLDLDIKNKDVLIVEDIVDSGLTLSYLIEYLKSFGPRSVKICTMIDKHERRQTRLAVDYACQQVEKGFLVGYGLDFAEDYRELPGIYHLKTNE